MDTLTNRRTNALIKYFYKTQKIPNHPCTHLIKYRSHRRHLNAKHKHKSAYGTRLTHHTDTLHIQIPQIEPTSVPVVWWCWPVAQLTLLLENKKSSYNHPEILSMFNEYMSEHTNYTCFYTDGSKGESGTGAAVVRKRGNVITTTEKARLPDGTSIFTAELFAILSYDI